MSVTVRAYEPRDKQAVRDICDATSTVGSKREELLLLYCDYYIEMEPQNAFVLVNERDEAVGYVICAADLRKHKRLYKEHYIKRLSAMNRASAAHKRAALLHSSLFYRNYPAHLHIDILKEYTTHGYGRLLMDALCEKLRSSGVRGVMLGCGENNKNAHKFYERYGFTLISKAAGTYFYGLKLTV